GRAVLAIRIVSAQPLAGDQPTRTMNNQVERNGKLPGRDSFANDALHALADIFDAHVIVYGYIVAKPDLRGLIAVGGQKIAQITKGCRACTPAVNDGNLGRHSALPGALMRLREQSKQRQLYISASSLILHIHSY